MIEISFSRHIGSCRELTASYINEAFNDYAWFRGRVKKGSERRKAINSFKLDSTTCNITFSLACRYFFSHADSGFSRGGAARVSERQGGEFAITAAGYAITLRPDQVPGIA